jgi:hypothetical protein
MNPSITWFPGVIIAPESLGALLNSNKSADEIFSALWSARYEADVEVFRKNLSSDERLRLAADAARQGLCDVLRSKRHLGWRSARCVVFEGRDGTVAYRDVTGNEHSPVLAQPFTGAPPPQFWEAYADAGLQALQAMRPIEPRPRSVAIAFAARFGNGEPVGVCSDPFVDDEPADQEDQNETRRSEPL